VVYRCDDKYISLENIYLLPAYKRVYYHVKYFIAEISYWVAKSSPE
jgi:hypothetical protein